MGLTLDGCPFRTGAQLATWLADEPGLSLALRGLRPIPVYAELQCATVDWARSRATVLWARVVVRTPRLGSGTRTSWVPRADAAAAVDFKKGHRSPRPQLCPDPAVLLGCR